MIDRRALAIRPPQRIASVPALEYQRPVFDATIYWPGGRHSGSLLLLYVRQPPQKSQGKRAADHAGAERACCHERYGPIRVMC